MDQILGYEPTRRQDNTNLLYDNHYRFHLDALPDLTFRVTNVTHPGVASAAVNHPSPFTRIQETGDALNFHDLSMTFNVDAAFKSYTSIFWWLKGYGFPHSYEEVQNFRAQRAAQLSNPRPQVRDMEKTIATLSVLLPDTETIVCNIRFTDVFPTALGEMSFNSTGDDTVHLRCTATFAYTEFDIYTP